MGAADDRLPTASKREHERVVFLHVQFHVVQTEDAVDVAAVQTHAKSFRIHAGTAVFSHNPDNDVR